MNTNEFDFQVLKLTDEFYNAYPTAQYEEIYIHHVKGESILHLSEFRRRYRYSPLKYFHNELQIID